MGHPVKRMPLFLLVAVGLLPSVQTAVSVYWQWHTPITYPAFKILMIAVPIAVWVGAQWSRREVCELVGLKRPNLPVGIAVGVLMSATILAGYYLLLRPTLDPGPVLAKVRSLGVLKYYWVMAVFISRLKSSVTVITSAPTGSGGVVVALSRKPGARGSGAVRKGWKKASPGSKSCQ